VDAEFPPIGAAPQKLILSFGFDSNDKILRIDQQQQAAPPQPVSEVIPGFVRGIINGALANGTPIVVAYTDENGAPVLSLRGSTQVYSDTQLCIWVRNADGGIVRTMARNNRVSLLYRDSKVRTTLIMQGRGHVETDPSVRERVFQLAPEVEQNHDPFRKGAALIIRKQANSDTRISQPARGREQKRSLARSQKAANEHDHGRTRDSSVTHASLSSSCRHNPASLWSKRAGSALAV